MYIVHPPQKISPCFTHPQSILGVYDYLLSDESNQSYIKNWVHPKHLQHSSPKNLNVKFRQVIPNHFFLLLNIKYYILKNVGNQTVAGLHWLP